MFKDKVYSKYLVTASTLTLWHGGNLDVYKDTTAHRGGRWEHGPGLYLTTHYDTAKKYAKGSRKLYRIVVEKGSDLYESKLDMEPVKDFIDTYVFKALRKDILARLEKYGSTQVPAEIFLNVMIDGKPGGDGYAIRSTDTDKLRQFLVSQGIDYAIVDNAFGWHERMLVLFNMDKIKSKQVVSPKEKIEEFDLPTTFTAEAAAKYHVVTADMGNLWAKFQTLVDNDSFVAEWVRNSDSLDDMFGLEVEEFTDEKELEQKLQAVAREWLDRRFREFEDEWDEKTEEEQGKLVGYRCIGLDNIDAFVKALKNGKYLKGYSGVGRWFSWNKDAAECHWGKGSKYITLKALIPYTSIDVKRTLWANMSISTGEEDEITLKDGSKIYVVEVLTENEDVLDAIKPLPAVAEV